MQPRDFDMLETLRRIALGVTHALMVLPAPEGAGEKRAWLSLIDAKDVVEAAIDTLERQSK